MIGITYIKEVFFLLETFSATISAMLVMFLCIAIGFLLRKLRLAPENTASVLSKLELYVFLPAQILVTFLNYCTVETLRVQYRVVLYGALAVGIEIVIGLLAARFFSKEKTERNIYLYNMIIANMGFLGNAIVPQIMGQEALYSYLLFCLPFNIVLYTWAINLLIPPEKLEKKSIWKKLAHPTLIAMAIGILLGLSGVGKVLPGFVGTTLKNLSGCMGPVAMLLTGFVIGGYQIRSLLGNGKVYIITFLRLLILPCATVGVLTLLGADKITALLGMFAAGAALGLNTVVVPAAYDGDTRPGAAMAMISHIGAVISIPLLYALFTQIL